MTCSVEIIGFMQPLCWIRHLLIWINNHQPLFGAIIAGSIASLSIWHANKNTTRQLENTQNLTKLEKKASYKAARAGLPFALTEISSYCQTCILTLNQVHEEKFESPANLNEEDAETDTKRTFEIPEFPAEPLRQITHLITFSSPETIKRLGQILSLSQIVHSNLKTTFNALKSNPKGKDFTITSADLHRDILRVILLGHLNNTMYNEGRGRTTKPDQIGDKEAAKDLYVDWSGAYSNHSIQGYLEDNWDREIEKYTQFHSSDQF